MQEKNWNKEKLKDLSEVMPCSVTNSKSALTASISLPLKRSTLENQNTHGHRRIKQGELKNEMKSCIADTGLDCNPENYKPKEKIAEPSNSSVSSVSMANIVGAGIKEIDFDNTLLQASIRFAL